jgi:RimJ/RimL family protein N-acetyltransferase
MDHNVYLAGHGFVLRPIQLHDAALIVELRSDPERARFLNPVSADIATQRAYLADYLTRPGDLYFVVDRRGTAEAEGLIALYDVDPVARQAEVGRWIIRPGSSAAIESIWLIYRVAFELLALAEVRCRTIAENTHAISFHDSCGLARSRVLPNEIQLGDRWFDRIEHRLTADRWPGVQEKLSRLAQSLAGRGSSCRAA